MTAAAYFDQTGAVALLLDNGAELNSHDGAGTTALTIACAMENRELVSFLLRKGADASLAATPSAVSAEDLGTPLMLAAYAESGDPGIARLLLASGANVNTVTRQGISAIVRARPRSHPAMLELLRSAGAEDLASPQTVSPRPLQLAPPAPDLRVAVEKSLAILQKADQEFLRRSGCKSCHNQSLPAMAIDLARPSGFRFDEQIARTQREAVAISVASLRSRALQMMEPDGGSPLSLSYALVSSRMPKDSVTAALVRNIAARQLPDGRWRPAAFRPPMEYGDVTATAMAVRAIQLYSPPRSHARYQTQVETAMRWLSSFEPRFTEERVFQLLALHWKSAPKDTIRSRARKLLDEQRPDGGWAQLHTLESDAYATGQAMYALLQSGALRPGDQACLNGVQFLLRTQAPDGSWYVKSRGIKFLTYLDAAFPYGQDQFISAAGTSWAAMALILGSR